MPLRQHAVELAARGDVELDEDLLQVVLGGTGADEQAFADLRVRQPVTGQFGDVSLLGRQLATGLDTALAGGLPGGPQLTPGPLGERLHAHRLQHLVGGAQLLAGVAPATLPAQPLPVEQVGTGELSPGTAEAVDRLAVQALGLRSVRH